MRVNLRKIFKKNIIFETISQIKLIDSQKKYISPSLFYISLLLYLHLKN